MNRHTGIAFENYVAKYYTNKVKHCKDENREFTLTLPDVRRLLSQKFCSYTGLPMTHQFVGSIEPRYSDVTIDRIDNTKGYVRGNVKAVAKGINELKSIAECPTNDLSIKHLTNFTRNINKIMKEKK